MLLTRKGLLWSLSWTFKLLTSNLCVKWLFHMEGYYTSLTATAFNRASNTSLAGNWCLMHWKRSKIARGRDWRKLSSLLLLKCKWSPLFSGSLIASELCTETWKRGLCLGGQETDILSYFYHHLLCSVICKPTAKRWAFTGWGCLCDYATELKSCSSGTALGDALAKCQRKGFAAILALGNPPGVPRV